jgi:hypothetical protein
MAVIPKSNIKFPDGSTLQDIYDAINSGSGGVTVCTSTTKPTSPSEGDLIYVTDNAAGKELEHYDGTAWQTVNDNSGSVQNPMTADLDAANYKIDNISAAQFGNSTIYGRIIWDDTDNRFRFYKYDGGANNLYWGDIDVNKIYFGHDNCSIDKDTNNNLVLTVPTDGSIILRTV